MVKQAFLPLDLELGVFLVAETSIIVKSDLQLKADGLELLVQKFIRTDAIGFRTDICGKLK